MLLTQLGELQGFFFFFFLKMQRRTSLHQRVQPAQKSNWDMECCDQWIRSASAVKSGTSGKKKKLCRGEKGSVHYSPGTILGCWWGCLLRLLLCLNLITCNILENAEIMLGSLGLFPFVFLSRWGFFSLGLSYFHDVFPFVFISTSTVSFILIFFFTCAL